MSLHAPEVGSHNATEERAFPNKYSVYFDYLATEEELDSTAKLTLVNNINTIDNNRAAVCGQILASGIEPGEERPFPAKYSVYFDYLSAVEEMDNMAKDTLAKDINVIDNNRSAVCSQLLSS
jgi:hypothetical protein